MAFRIQLRRDISDKWEINNPILLSGEIGYETDTAYIKIGDGTTYWNDLVYWSGGVTGGSLIVKKNNVTIQSPTNILNFSDDFNVSSGTSNTAEISLSGGSPSTFSLGILKDGVLGLTGATGINFTGNSTVTYNGKVATVNLLGSTSPVYIATVTLSGGNFASFSSSSGPDGQPLTGSNWNFSFANTSNNITITHNLGAVPFGLATHGTNSNNVFINSPFGISDSGFSLSYPINKNSFTVYGVNSTNTGAALAGTVDIVWSFGSTL
jgi:hypothetical protein